MQDVGPLQDRADGAHQRDFEPVEHPGDAQADYEQPMKPAPRQAIEPCRDQGFEGFNDAGQSGHLILLALQGFDGVRVSEMKDFSPTPDASAAEIKAARRRLVKGLSSHVLRETARAAQAAKTSANLWGFHATTRLR